MVKDFIELLLDVKLCKCITEKLEGLTVEKNRNTKM